MEDVFSRLPNKETRDAKIIRTGGNILGELRDWISKQRKKERERKREDGVFQENKRKRSILEGLKHNWSDSDLGAANATISYRFNWAQPLSKLKSTELKVKAKT